MRLLPVLLLCACGFNSRFAITYTGAVRGDLITREEGGGWAGMSFTPEASVDFEALADGLVEQGWSGGDRLDDVDVVRVQAWIDTSGRFVEEGCPDLLDPTICQPGPDDPSGALEQEVAPVGFHTWTLTITDPE